jgi:O-antigen ligase
MLACKHSNGRLEVQKIKFMRFPLRRTPFDIPLAIFLLTAGVGVWAAYNRSTAWNKFWLIAAGILLYYVIATRKQSDIWTVVGILSTCSAALAVYYFISPSAIEPDTVAGILAVIFPFTITWGINRWRKHLMLQVLVALILCGFMAFTMVVSKERGLWLGLAILVVLLSLAVRFRKIVNSRKMAVIIYTIALTCILIGAVFTTLPATHGTVEKFLPSLGPRLEGITNTAYLAVEYPLIGGGLGSYAGLYSRYILVIPYLFLQHGHNLFLDVAVEQGWIGLAALLWIFIGSAWLVFREWANEKNDTDQVVLRVAVLCSIFLLVIHNLTEDALYSSQGVVCLFIVPGLSFLESRKTFEPAHTPDAGATVKRNRWLVNIVVSGITLLLVIGFWRPLAGVFYSNLGAVEMARVQLKDWPAEGADGATLLAVTGPAESTFLKALKYNPKQATALYRLGMIVSERGDYERVKQYLSQAYEVYPAHYGIRKLLGYGYLWLGDVEKAASLLNPDSETLKELDSYAHWWTTQNRSDLSMLAQQASSRLREIEK